jgi:hypothetical protein
MGRVGSSPTACTNPFSFARTVLAIVFFLLAYIFSTFSFLIATALLSFRCGTRERERIGAAHALGCWLRFAVALVCFRKLGF